MIESEAERAAAAQHVAELRRTAADLGIRILDPIFAAWEQAGVTDKTAPALLQRAPVVARLYAAHIG